MAVSPWNYLEDVVLFTIPGPWLGNCSQCCVSHVASVIYNPEPAGVIFELGASCHTGHPYSWPQCCIHFAC